MFIRGSSTFLRPLFTSAINQFRPPSKLVNTGQTSTVSTNISEEKTPAKRHSEKTNQDLIAARKLHEVVEDLYVKHEKQRSEASRGAVEIDWDAAMAVIREAEKVAPVQTHRQRKTDE